MKTKIILSLGLLCLLAATSPEAAAQPRIITQPKNAAIQLSQDAQFMVTASGVAPLTYQWRFNGVDLLKATNRTLALTNVALNQLGRYEVEVRNSAGTVTSDPAWLLLATRWTELVVFDDSGAMQICTGPAWPDHLAYRLGVRLRNYAQGGADTAGIRSQINSYLSTSTPTTNTLLAHWTGGPARELAVDRLPVERAVSNRLANVRQLAEAGARSLLLPTYPPFELMPFLVAGYPHMTNEVGQAFDAQLDQGLEELEAEFSITIYRPDMFAFFVHLHENPAAYGFRAPAAGSKFLGSDFRCDDRHFSTQAARVLADEFHRSLTPPLRIDSAALSPDGGLEINWSGGLPPFRLERTADLSSSQWQSVGELTFQSSGTVPPDGARAFFRVLHLGQ
jgi:hypothetical protein